MEIMGGLIKLSKQNILPIPWFMRAHLGLETGSKIWYAVTKPVKPGRLPDIIVSPLDPRNFRDITTVTLSYVEGIGTLADVLDNIRPPVNIALADSVTLERRDIHRINLVVERAQGGRMEDYQEKRSEFIRRFSFAPGEPDYGLSHSPIYGDDLAVFSGAIRTKVMEGQINVGHVLDGIAEAHRAIAGQYDFSKVVVSSNPDQRLIRYIIPRKGVVTLRVPHEDVPRVLHSVVKGIADHKYNILCSRLSRAKSRREDSSTFVAECEPIGRGPNPAKLLKDLTSNEQIYLGTYHDGVSAKEVLYPKPAGSVNIRPHTKYRDDIKNMAKKLKGKKSMFLSRRFVELKTEDAGIKADYLGVLQEIRCGAQMANWEAQEAPPNKTDDLIDQAVFPALWLSQAILVLAFFEDGSGQVSLNQAMELGFGRGQNKPTAILIDGDRSDDFKVSNHSGRTLLTYSRRVAFNSDDPGSIRNKVRDWLLSLEVDPLD